MIKCRVDNEFLEAGPPIRPDANVPLIDFRVNRLSAVINDLSQLANFGSEVFERIVHDSTGIFERLHELSERVSKCEASQAATRGKCQASLTGFTWTAEKNNYRSANQMSADFFNTNTKDRSLALLYEQAQPPPELQKIDPFRADGKQSLKIYTNPQFFIETWAAKREQEDKERKADRKKRRAIRNKKDVVKQSTKTIRGVKVKKYDQYGDLIPEPRSNRGSKVALNEDEETYANAGVINRDTHQSMSPSRGTMSRRSSNIYANSGPISRNASGSSMGPPPSEELPAIPSMPPPKPPGTQPPKPPPSIPATAMPKGPPARPLDSAPAPQGPRIQPPPQPPHPVMASPEQQYRQVPAAPPPPAPALPPPTAAPPTPAAPPLPASELAVVKPKIGGVGGNLSLLEQIKTGKQLKKTEVVARKQSAQQTNSSVAAILARRFAIDASDSDSDGGDSSDDGDWD